jgi:hypothetical protein
MMMKKSMLTLLLVLVMVGSLFTACGRAAQTGGDSQGDINGEKTTTGTQDKAASETAATDTSAAEASTTIENVTETTAETTQETAAMSETTVSSESTAETIAATDSGNGTQSVSNDLLQKDMEAVDSYRRKVFYISTPPKEAGSPIDVTTESAYVKEPFAVSYMNESKAFGSYIEQIIIGDTIWERSTKDGEWKSSTPDPVTKPSFQYSTRPMHYPIDFEKLSLAQAGNEQVNGFDCVKFDVSGSYQGEFTLYEGTEYEAVQQISLSCKGSIWVAFDPVLGQILIRERITVNRDTVDPKNLDQDGNVQHSLAEDVIEDDVTDINAVVIKAPVG